MTGAGDDAATFLVLPRGLDLSLAGNLKNQGAQQRLIVLFQDMGSRRATSTYSTKRLRVWVGGRGEGVNLWGRG